MIFHSRKPIFYSQWNTNNMSAAETDILPFQRKYNLDFDGSNTSKEKSLNRVMFLEFSESCCYCPILVWFRIPAVQQFWSFMLDLSFCVQHLDVSPVKPYSCDGCSMYLSIALLKHARPCLRKMLFRCEQMLFYLLYLLFSLSRCQSCSRHGH